LKFLNLCELVEEFKMYGIIKRLTFIFKYINPKKFLPNQNHTCNPQTINLSNLSNNLSKHQDDQEVFHLAYNIFNGNLNIGFNQESPKEEDNGSSPKAKPANAPLGFLQDR
jgi:hypothetical protein